MADVIPTGPLSKPFGGAADLLAACPTFQAVCGVASASEALDKIYYPYFDHGVEDNEWPVPGIIINDDDMNQQYMDRDRDQGGSLLVTFCFPINDTYKDQPENQILDFRNKLGAVLNEMLELSNTTNPDSVDGFGYLHVVKWEKWSTPVVLGGKFAVNDLMHAAFVIDWV